MHAADGAPKAAPPLIRSARSGAWSDAATWEGGKVPGAGPRRGPHRPRRALRRDVRRGHPLHPRRRHAVVRHGQGHAPDVGLIKIQPGDDASEEGFDCDAHARRPDARRSRGPPWKSARPTSPIDAKHTATDPAASTSTAWTRQSCPAIVCCGGRMDFHGAPLSRTWVKLGATAKQGDATVTLAEPVTGWRVGDRVIVTATTRQNKRKKTFTRQRARQHADRGTHHHGRSTATTLTLDQPLEFEHLGDGDYRGEVANLSRNVVVESADPAGRRGHTMYHRDSAGSISYAEFRHLGKEGVLGRYSLHFHLCRRHDARQLRRSARRSGTAATAG